MNTPEQDREELAAALEVVRNHQNKQGIFHATNNLAERIKTVIAEYEQRTSQALSKTKAFRDRLLIDMRALNLVLQMVSSASTHQEKNARLRGSIELLNGAYDRLESEHFDLSFGGPSFDDPFRPDFPTRRLQEKISELEGLLKQYEQNPNEQNPNYARH